MDNCTAGAVGGAASWSRSGPRWSATSLSCSALPPTWPTFANRWPVSTSATPGALRSQAAPAGTLRDQVSCRPARGVTAPRFVRVSRKVICCVALFGKNHTWDRRARAVPWLSSTTDPAGAARRGSSRGSTAGQTGRARSRPGASASNAASGQPRLRVGWRLAAARHGLPRRQPPRCPGKGGGGHRCAGRVAPQGRAHCKHAATPSPSGGGGPSVQRRPVRSATAVAQPPCAMSCRASKRSRLRGWAALRARSRKSASVWSQRS